MSYNFAQVSWRKRRSAQQAKQPIQTTGKKAGNGVWTTGSSDLKSSGSYTPRFCKFILNHWETHGGKLEQSGLDLEILRSIPFPMMPGGFKSAASSTKTSLQQTRLNFKKSANTSGSSSGPPMHTTASLAAGPEARREAPVYCMRLHAQDHVGFLGKLDLHHTDTTTTTIITPTSTSTSTSTIATTSISTSTTTTQPNDDFYCCRNLLAVRCNAIARSCLIIDGSIGRLALTQL
jgi:hypothetical protein